MGEVKRYAIGSAFLIDGADVDELVHESGHGSFVYFSDYDTIRAEVERLRKVDAAAMAGLPALRELYDTYQRAADYAGEGCFGLDDDVCEGAESAINSLAEACGRKG